MIKLFQKIFKKCGLDLYVMPYKCISNRTGDEKLLGGIIECIPNSYSRDQLGKAFEIDPDEALAYNNRGIVYRDKGDYDSAVDLVLPIVEIAHRFGGSNAQRDVVHRTLVEAAIRAGRGNLARALVAERLSQKPDSLYNKTSQARADALTA